MKQTSLGKGVRRMRAVELRVASCSCELRVRVASCELRVASCELRVASCELRATSYEFKENIYLLYFTASAPSLYFAFAFQFILCFNEKRITWSLTLIKQGKHTQVSIDPIFISSHLLTHNGAHKERGIHPIVMFCKKRII